MDRRAFANGVLLAACLIPATVVGSHAQSRPSTPLRNLVDDQVVAKIG